MAVQKPSDWELHQNPGGKAPASEPSGSSKGDHYMFTCWITTTLVEPPQFQHTYCIWTLNILMWGICSICKTKLINSAANNLLLSCWLG